MFADSIGKSVELLRAVLPAAKRMAVLTSSNPNHPRQYELAEAAGKALGLVAIQILAPASTDLDQAFDRMAQEKCDALFVLADPIRPTIVPLAAKTKIPTVYQFSAYVDLGGLASYGASITLMAKQTAQYADKIFKGADPADLPVEQPVVFELARNPQNSRGAWREYSRVRRGPRRPGDRMKRRDVRVCPGLMLWTAPPPAHRCHGCGRC
jgi:putative ABC transport system substrate-binding protein